MPDRPARVPSAPVERQLRQALESSPTESELRSLSEQADAWMLVLQGLIAEGEERLAECGDDPARDLAEIAARLRRVESLRREADELQCLHERLDEQKRTLRARWLAGRPGLEQAHR